MLFRSSRVMEMRQFADRSLGVLPAMNEMRVEALYAHGFRMAKDIAAARPEILAQVIGLDPSAVVAIQEAARQQMEVDLQELDRLAEAREARRLEEERKHPDELTQDERLARVRGIGSNNVDSFKLSNYSTVEDITKETDLTRLGNVEGIGIKKARQIKTAAEHYLQEENRRRAELDQETEATV